jgi:hypothetical protein
VTLRPGAWLGLPTGWPDPIDDAALLRLVLVSIAILCGILVARAHKKAAFVSGVSFAICAIGFWFACLERPYGLLVDPERDVALCEIAVHSVAEQPESGCVLGTPSVSHLYAGLGQVGARLGLPLDALLSLPSLLPLVSFVIMGALLALFSGMRSASCLILATWFALAATQLDFVLGSGGLTTLWRQPVPMFLLPLPAAVALGIAHRTRSVVSGQVWVPLALSLIGLAVAGLTSDGSRFSLGHALREAWLAPGLWTLVGWVGAVRRPRGPALGFLAAGLVQFTLGSTLLSLEPAWCGAWYRVGLVLGTAALLQELLEPAARRFLPRGGLGASSPRALVEGLLVAALLSGSTLMWWNPHRADTVMSASTLGESPRLLAAMQWIRDSTPTRAGFLASPQYGTAITVLTGRRVFRAPSLTVTPNDARRRAIERRLLWRSLERRPAKRLGITHVFVGPGDRAGDGGWAPDQPSSALALLHSDHWGFDVYALAPLEASVPETPTVSGKTGSSANARGE